jgi:DNA adenine methylase
MIAALAPWYGSKRTLAPTIVEQLGPHHAYWEPFCGSLAVLLSKPPVTYELANDLHRELTNLALALQDRDKAERLYNRVYRTLFDEGLCQRARDKVKVTEDDPSTGDVDRAYWYMVSSWFDLSGIAGTRLRRKAGFRVRHTADGGNGAGHWKSVVGSIAAWHERLRGVQILCRDGFSVLESAKDERDAAIYVDPPYLQKKSRYQHDFSPEDHRRLAELLRRFKRSRVVLSYYDDPLLGELYAGWERLESSELGVAKAMVQSGMRDQRGKVQAPELLLVNGPIWGRQPQLF